jgi:hypothetical protein
MKNIKQTLYRFTTLSLIIILSYTSGFGISVAQQQNEITNQTQMQFGWWFMSYPKNDPMKSEVGSSLRT